MCAADMACLMSHRMHSGSSHPRAHGESQMHLRSELEHDLPICACSLGLYRKEAAGA